MQCASALDNLGAFYFHNVTAGEVPSSPASLNMAKHILDCPTVFPEVCIYFMFLLCTNKSYLEVILI